MKVCELIALLQTCIQDFELKEIIFTKDKMVKMEWILYMITRLCLVRRQKLPMNNINNEKEKNNS